MWAVAARLPPFFLEWDEGIRKMGSDLLGYRMPHGKLITRYGFSWFNLDFVVLESVSVWKR